MPDHILPLAAPMTSSSPFIERPVVFPAGPEELSGVYCQPGESGAGHGVVLLTGGGFIASTHRNGTWVRLARLLAAGGWGVLRFDYHGVGESTGEVTKFGLDQPFADDVDGAVQWMRAEGVAPSVLVGSCFGARTILAAADRIPELQAVILVSVPLFGKTLAGKARRALPTAWRRVLDPAWRSAALRLVRRRVQHSVGLRRSPRANGALSAGRREIRHAASVPDGLRWVSPRFLGDLRRMLARPLRVLMLYGTEEDYYLEFQRALGQGLDRILSDAAATVEVRTVGGVLHGFTTLAAQRFAIATAVDWLGAARSGIPLSAGTGQATARRWDAQEKSQ